uniref:zinc ribbon domain-containing protein n=1 Tax=Okeania sp. SIO2F4 TaxID=2607790 RepID=UPI0025E766A9|nr:zinc ribbon domain-containing protein [Okeania sp. SIO2F4]
MSVRTHSCPKCKIVLDRDENAAINILNKALNEVGIILYACGGYEINQPVKQETSLFGELPVIIFDLTGDNFTTYHLLASNLKPLKDIVKIKI